MKPSVLITGGAGFIGSQLGHALDAAGHKVTLIDNMSDGHADNLEIDGKRFGEFIEMDVRAPEMSDVVAGHDVLFHFAGTSSLPKCQSDPGAAYDNNVTAVARLLEQARRAGVKRFVFSSTSAVYENNKETPFREDATVAPDLVYACTKQAAERVCAGFAATYGLDVVITRFFNIYGEHQDIHRTNPPFLSYLSRELVQGRRPVLFNQSDAERDYVYVGDVIDMLRRVMASDGTFRGDIFNVCSGSGYSVPGLVDLYARVTGAAIDPEYRDPSAFWDKFPGLFEGALTLDRARIEAEVYKHSLGDPSKAKAAFGFRAATALEDGLARAFAYSKAQLS
ncbi:MAG: NAD-dependent epimerase/dehydratase family protein [Pseudomonadota bacterium]